MADEQQIQSPGADTKAAKVAASAPKQVELPDVLTLSSAAEYAGAQAENFFYAVAFAAVGDITQHYHKSVDLKSLQDAANDELNTDRETAKRVLENVRAIFARFLNK